MQSETSTTNQSKTLHWYESWIVRAAAVVVLVLCLAYSASVLISLQTITSVSNMAYDPEVATALGDHLKTIREIYTIRQKTIAERITQYASTLPRLPDNETEFFTMMHQVELPEGFDLDQATIKLNAYSYDPAQPLVQWEGLLKVRVGAHELSFVDNKYHADFLRIDGLRQRYQFIGAALDKEIKPTLMKANTLILGMAFVAIIAVFAVLIRRFKRAVEAVIGGFIYWAERDKSFRFGNTWSGELRLITAQFNAMADDVEESRRKSIYLEKVASWQTIAKKLAHEIKNPLTPIQMMVAQIKRRYSGDDIEYAALLESAHNIINQEVQALRRLVDHFSQFARLPTPQLRSADLVPLLKNACELQQAAYEHAKISFTTSANSVDANIDPDLLRQVLINLIKNAAEACTDAQPLIDVSLREDYRHIIITVHDEGPGIPEEMQKNIFEAYFTTKHFSPNPGMGLGLAICKKIIMDHDGELTVQSQPKNTNFVIKLPKKPYEDHS